MTDQSYVCPDCGQKHEGLPTDWGFKLPDDVWNLSFLDKYKKSRFNSDLCTLEENRYFIRTMLNIPMKKDFFSWGVWTETDKDTHDFYVENYSNEAVSGQKFRGRVANDVPGFSPTRGLPVEITLSPNNDRPAVTFAIDLAHDLAADQRIGIDAEKHHEYLRCCGFFDECDA